jgi:hypothetical protein
MGGQEPPKGTINTSKNANRGIKTEVHEVSDVMGEDRSHFPALGLWPRRFHAWGHGVRPGGDRSRESPLRTSAQGRELTVFPGELEEAHHPQ